MLNKHALTEDITMSMIICRFLLGFFVVVVVYYNAFFFTCCLFLRFYMERLATLCSSYYRSNTVLTKAHEYNPEICNTATSFVRSAAIGHESKPSDQSDLCL